MKRCPECRRDYYDDTLLYCLDDGSALLEGPASVDEPATAILPETSSPAEEATTVQVHTTEHPAVLSSGARDVSRSRGFDKRLILVPLALTVIFLGGFAGYRYFEPINQIESIAVLPFVNESGNADVEYLSDGMTETLINSLSQIPNFSVKARSAVFRYKGTAFDLKRVASELGVQAILTGRVIQRGDQLILNLELIDAQTENTVWGNRYDRKFSDLLALQSEIARDVSSKLQTRLSGADATKVTKNSTASPEAYQLFLRGRFYTRKRTAKDALTATEYFQQAIAIDRNYALAYAGLGEATWFIALYSYPQANELIPRAKELARKAIELDDTLAEPHSILGTICYNFDHDLACMERETRAALEINPDYWEAHRRLGLVYGNLGRIDEARASIRRALDIDPLSPISNMEMVRLLYFERKYDESARLLEKTIELDRNFWLGHMHLFHLNRVKQNYAEAVEALAKMQDARGELDAAKLIRESYADGNWKAFLSRVTRERPRLKLYAYLVATLYAELGDKEKALATLDEAVETYDQNALWMKMDQTWDSLRDDPRFKAISKKAGFPE